MNEGNLQMSALDRRLSYFEGVVPPREWVVVLDGTMHRYDDDNSMRLPKETYKILLDLTVQKNLSVVFVGSDLDANHAREMFQQIGQGSFPWISCINEYQNAAAFISFAKFVISNQTHLSRLALQNDVPTCVLEVDPKIPFQSQNDSHVMMPVGEHHKVIEWVDKYIE